jgi:tetratricopeptide (TPR) repeat protein
VVERAENRPAAEFWSRHMLAHLHARLGDFEAARGAMDSWRTQLRELGQQMRYFGTADCAWDICWLADDWAGGEHALREAYAEYERTGDRSTGPIMAAHLAEAMLRQGKLDEAEDYSRVSERLGAPDDVFNEAAWRRVRAGVLAARGEIYEAVALARRAVEILSQTDFVDEHAAAWLRLAAILREAGEDKETSAALREAIALYEQKGNLVGRAKAEALLASS